MSDLPNGLGRIVDTLYQWRKFPPDRNGETRIRMIEMPVPLLGAVLCLDADTLAEHLDDLLRGKELIEDSPAKPLTVSTWNTRELGTQYNVGIERDPDKPNQLRVFSAKWSGITYTSAGESEAVAHVRLTPKGLTVGEHRRRNPPGMTAAELLEVCNAPIGQRACDDHEANAEARRLLEADAARRAKLAREAIPGIDDPFDTVRKGLEVQRITGIPFREYLNMPAPLADKVLTAAAKMNACDLAGKPTNASIDARRVIIDILTALDSDAAFRDKLPELIWSNLPNKADELGQRMKRSDPMLNYEELRTLANAAGVSDDAFRVAIGELKASGRVVASMAWLTELYRISRTYFAANNAEDDGQPRPFARINPFRGSADADTIKAVQLVYHEWDGENWDALRPTLRLKLNPDEIESMTVHQIRMHYAALHPLYVLELGGQVNTTDATIIPGEKPYGVIEIPARGEPEKGEAPAPRLLDRHFDVMNALNLMEAKSRETRRTAKEIAKKVFWKDDAYLVKETLGQLTELKYTDSIKGRNGGSWLTKAGAERLECEPK